MMRWLNDGNAVNKRKSKGHRLTLETVIARAMGVSVLYLMGVLLQMPLEWIFGLLLCSMTAIVWMAVRILKDPCSTEKTFDEYFYQDRDDMRRTKAE